MNTTKKIYFLSAFVLIIGCLALNLSYSLFIQTEEKEIANATVPELVVGLSAVDNEVATYSTRESDSLTSWVLVEAGKEYLIKQTITNSSDVAINYSLLTDKPDNVSIAREKNTPDNLPYGFSTEGTEIESNSSRDLFFVVSNKDGQEDIVINFTLQFNYYTIYSTIENSNITKVSELNLDKLPYSDNPQSLAFRIIQQQVDKFGNPGDGLSSLFSGEIVKVVLPLEPNSNLNIPSPIEFTGVEVNEVGLYKAQDDYGISYYFRGASTVNYVNFAGFTWRIVRINGDGTIRLILDGTLDKVYRKNEDGTVSSTPAGATSKYNLNSYDNAYIGYMYGTFTDNSTSYNEAHRDEVNSEVKENVDLFYETYIQNGESNYDFEKYLSDALFCGDKTLASKSIGSSNKRLGFGTYITYYAATERLYYSSGTTRTTIATPALECAKGAADTYSRYTSQIDSSTTTNKGVLVNNVLNYPIALLSADELVMAGAWGGAGTTKNIKFYLYNNNVSLAWWTMTPYRYASGGTMFSNYSISTSFGENEVASITTGRNGIRPVINLRSDVLVKQGNGSKATPYEIKLPGE